MLDNWEKDPWKTQSGPDKISMIVKKFGKICCKNTIKPRKYSEFKINK